VHELQDIETLNRRALKAELEVTAASIHAYAFLADNYALLPHGASMGEGYGPRLVAREPLTHDELLTKTVAVPGMLTSAYLALQLYAPGIKTVVVPFDEILERVAAGEYDVGLLIHEGQLTYMDAGLHLIRDMGEWWAAETGGLPLPLGGNLIRKDLGEEMIKRVSRILRDSIAFGLKDRANALAHAESYGRGLDPAQTDEFVGMYVNERTLEYGDDGRRAVQLFLDRGYEAGIIPHRVEVAFVED
jgi:1,4-dihydroxy-6-naphthoate synthase